MGNINKLLELQERIGGGEGRRRRRRKVDKKNKKRGIRIRRCGSPRENCLN